MASFRRAPRRHPSGLMALAAVGAALAAAPTAQAQLPTFDFMYWTGGAATYWDDNNWVNVTGQYETPAWEYTTLYFGDADGSGRDNDGLVINDVENDLKMKGMYLYGQDWRIDGKSLRMLHANSFISLQSPNMTVTVNANIKLQGAFGVVPSLSLAVPTSSSVLINSQMYGVGSLYKSGQGTAELRGFHNYTEGTNVDAGRLIDYAPHGNYRTNGFLEFHIDNYQTSTGDIRGGGTVVKSGLGDLLFSGGLKDYTGATVVNQGNLFVDAPSNSSSYTINENGRLEFRIAGARTYANPITGSGAFIKTGAGALTLSSSKNRFDGFVFIEGGRLIEVDPNGGNRYLRGGSLQFNVSSDRVYAGSIFGGANGSFTKDGAGTLTLAGLDTYSGGTTVLNGRLIDLDPQGDYTVYGALEFRATGDKTFSDFISGNGSFSKNGDGVLTLTRANTYAGGTTVSRGRLIDRNPHGSYVTNAELEFQMVNNQLFANPITGVPYSIGGTGNFTKSGAGNLVLSGALSYDGSTTITEAGIGSFVNNALPIATALTIGANGIFQTAGGVVQTVGSLAGAGKVALGGAFMVNGPASTTFSGEISGNAPLTKGGAGTLTLSGANTYSGGTTVNGGRLIDANPHGDYSNNASLEFATTGTKSYAGVVSGTGSFTKSGAGTLTLTRSGSLSGNVAIEEGALRAGVKNAIDFNTSLKVNAGGTFDLDGYEQGLQGLNGSGRVKLGSGSYLYVRNNGAETFDGVLSGAGIFGKTGYGTLTLTGLNSSTGGTFVNDGRLVVTNPFGDYGVESSLEARTAGDQTLAGTISRSGSFVKSGAGTLTLTGLNTYTGGTTVQEGRLIDLNPHGGYVTNAKLEFAKAGDYAYDAAIAGKGSFTKSGAGTLTLSGINVYSGGTTVKEGRLIDLNPHGDYVTNATLEFAKATDSSFGGIVDGAGTFAKGGAGALTLTGSIKQGVKTRIEGGTLKVTTGTVYGDVTGAAGTTLQFDQASGVTYSARYSGAGALLKTDRGTLVLTNAPTNSGGVRVSGGTLSVRGAGAFGGGLSVDRGATLDFGASGALTIGGASLNAGAVFTGFGSTIAFTGPVSGTGDFTGAGTVRFDGGYSPGNSPASVRFDGNMALGSTSVLTMELGGADLGTGYDHLSVLGTATLGGTLNVVSTNGFSPAWGQSFHLFDFSSSNGAFASVNLPSLSNGLVWNTSALYTTGTVQAVPEPASFAILGLGALGLLRRRHKA